MLFKDLRDKKLKQASTTSFTVYRVSHAHPFCKGVEAQKPNVVDFCNPVCSARYNNHLGIRYSRSFNERWPSYYKFYTTKQDEDDVGRLCAFAELQFRAENAGKTANKETKAALRRVLSQLRNNCETDSDSDDNEFTSDTDATSVSSDYVHVVKPDK